MFALQNTAFIVFHVIAHANWTILGGNSKYKYYSFCFHHHRLKLIASCPCEIFHLHYPRSPPNGQIPRKQPCSYGKRLCQNFDFNGHESESYSTNEPLFDWQLDDSWTPPMPWISPYQSESLRTWGQLLKFRKNGWGATAEMTKSTDFRNSCPSINQVRLRINNSSLYFGGTRIILNITGLPFVRLEKTSNLNVNLVAHAKQLHVWGATHCTVLTGELDNNNCHPSDEMKVKRWKMLTLTNTTLPGGIRSKALLDKRSVLNFCNVNFSSLLFNEH